MTWPFSKTAPTVVFALHGKCHAQWRFPPAHARKVTADRLTWHGRKRHGPWRFLPDLNTIDLGVSTYNYLIIIGACKHYLLEIPLRDNPLRNIFFVFSIWHALHKKMPSYQSLYMLLTSVWQCTYGSRHALLSFSTTSLSPLPAPQMFFNLRVTSHAWPQICQCRRASPRRATWWQWVGIH